MASPLLLDTCAAIWVAESEPMSKAAQDALDEAYEDEAPVWISPISAWEIGMLVSLGRMRIQIKPQLWFQRLLQDVNLSLAEMPPEVLIAASQLPAVPTKDPADRIILATAREYGYRIVTRDRPILSYAAEGHVQAITC